MPTDDEKRAPTVPPVPPAAPDDPNAPAGADPKSVRNWLEGMIPDLVKRTFHAGIGAAFATEEGIRRLANEFSLPKEVAAYLLSTAANTKDEVFKVIAREVREFLEGLNLNDVLVKTLTSLSFEVKTEIRFIPNDGAVGGVKPDMKKKVSLKRVKEDGTTEDIPTGDERNARGR